MKMRRLRPYVNWALECWRIRSPVDADADDATISRLGPMSADLLSLVVQPGGKDVFETRCGYWTHAMVRSAYEAHQKPILYLRRVGILFGLTGLSFITFVQLRVDGGTSPGAISAEPFWLYACQALHACVTVSFFSCLPAIARRRRWLSALDRPRVVDLLLMLFLVLHLLLLPGFVEWSEPFLNLSAESAHRSNQVLRIAAYGVAAAASGVFFSPLLAMFMAAFVMAAFTYRFNRFVELLAASGIVRATLPEPLAFHEFYVTALVCLLVVIMHERQVPSLGSD